MEILEQEMRGIPLRVELGPKDIAANKCVVVRRDTREKIEVSLDEIETKIPELLETVQKDMFARAKAHRDAISGMHIITKNLRILQKINRDSSVVCGARSGM